MSHPIYYVPAGDVLPIYFSTYDGGTGASMTMTGLAVTDIEIYKDASMTQRASDAGYTLIDTDGIDIDSVTGIHGFTIDTGDNTDASFYTVGAWFTVVVSSVTVDAQTVNFIAAQFRLMPAESVAGKPKVDVDTFGGTAATTSGGRPEVNTTHAAGTAWASGAITAASIAADAITAAKIADGAIDAATLASDTITAAKIATGAITNAKFAAGAIDAAAIAADAIGASELAADAATEIGTAVWATTTRLLTAGTNIALAKGTGVTGFNDLDAAGIRTAVGLASANLDTQLTAIDDFLDTEIAAIKAKTDNLPATPAATGDIPTAAAVADAVWDEATLGHTTSGTFGEQLKTDVDAILVDTDVIGATGAGLTSLATQASVNTIDDLLDTEVAAILAAVDTDVAAIKAVTDNLPNSGALTNLDAAISSRATPAQVNAEVVDALATDTYAEPGQGAPAATAALSTKISYLYKSWRNKKTNDGTDTKLFADDGTTVDQKQATSESAGTVTKAEWITGA